MPPADDEARKVAEEIGAAVQGWLHASSDHPAGGLVSALVPILLDFAKRVREPLLYTSDKQTVAWKERALKSEAEAARLKAELESKVHAIRSLQARLTAQTEHLQKFVDGNGKRTLRAQLSEAQAGLASAMAEVHRHTQRADREMYRADNAQQRVEALERALREIAAAGYAFTDPLDFILGVAESALARPEAPTPEVKP